MPVAGSCHFCGREIRQERIGFREECPGCGNALHACMQCAFYAPGRSNDCQETQVEPVREKDRSNLCDWFRFGPAGSGATGAGGLSRDQAEQMLKDLFRK